MPTYTVVVAMDCTRPQSGDRPFFGHQTIDNYDSDGALLTRVVVRYARFHNLLGALLYLRDCRRQPEVRQGRMCVDFRVGPVAALNVGGMAVPEAVSR